LHVVAVYYCFGCSFGPKASCSSFFFEGFGFIPVVFAQVFAKNRLCQLSDCELKGSVVVFEHQQSFDHLLMDQTRASKFYSRSQKHSSSSLHLGFAPCASAALPCARPACQGLVAEPISAGRPATWSWSWM
jgi:hypothetical protein